MWHLEYLKSVDIALGEEKATEKDQSVWCLSIWKAFYLYLLPLWSIGELV